MNRLAGSLDRIRLCLREDRVAEASRLCEDLALRHPTEPEVLLLLGQIDLMCQRESRALATVLAHPHLPGFRPLAQALADHFFCRDQMVQRLAHKQDPAALAALQDLHEAWEVRPSYGVGVGLTACLIVKDEAENLPRCLNSLKGVVDEIVVVDTGSKDDTVAIAESFGARVGHFAWVHDFAAARNASLELATQPWCLWIDADEAWIPGGEAMLHEALTRPQFGGFNVRIVNHLRNGAEAIEFVHSPVRIFRNHPHIRFTGRIHEQIASGILDLGLATAMLPDVQLDHFGYLPEAMEERNKLERTIGMIERELEEDPGNSFQLFNLASALSVARKYKEVAGVCARAAEVVPPSFQVGFNLFHLWAVALNQTGHPAEALRVVADAEARGYLCVLSEHERSLALAALERWPEAEASAERACGMDWPDRLCGDTSVFTYMRYVQWAKCRQMRADRAGAIAALNQGLERRPDQPYLLGFGVRLAVELGEPHLALEFADRLPTEFQPDVELLRARALLDAGEPRGAIKILQARWERGIHEEDAAALWVTAAERTGDPDLVTAAFSALGAATPPTPDRLLQWGCMLDAQGEVDRALTCFQEAMRIDPRHANAAFLAGDLHYRLGHYLDAAHCYQQGLTANVDHADGWFVLGNTLFQLGALDQAKSAYAQCLARSPEHPGARHNLALASEAQRVA